MNLDLSRFCNFAVTSNFPQENSGTACLEIQNIKLKTYLIFMGISMYASYWHSHQIIKKYNFECLNFKLQLCCIFVNFSENLKALLPYSIRLQPSSTLETMDVLRTKVDGGNFCCIWSKRQLQLRLLGKELHNPLDGPASKGRKCGRNVFCLKKAIEEANVEW